MKKLPPPIYRIVWEDPASHLDENLKKPFKKYLAVRTNYGYLKEDGDYIAIVSADFSEDPDPEAKQDFTIIPKKLILSKEYANKKNIGARRSDKTK